MYSLKEAGKFGLVETIKKLIKKGIDDFYECFYEACKNNHIRVVKFLIEKNYCIYEYKRRSKTNKFCDMGFYYACKKAHIRIVNFLIEKGFARFNIGFIVACKKGNKKIVNILIEKKTNNPYYDFTACKYMNDFLSAIFKMDFIDNHKGFIVACKKGRKKIVNLLIDKIENDIYVINKGFAAACKGGHIKIVKLLIEKGADAFIRGFIMARDNDHHEIVELLDDKIKNKNICLLELID